MQFNGFVTRRERIRVVSYDPDGPPFIEIEVNIPRWQTFEVPDPPEKSGPGRRAGPPFIDRADCLSWLRSKADLLIKDEQPVNLERLAKLAMGSRGITTEEPKNAAKTVRRWCQYYTIDFPRDVEKYFRA